MQRKDRLKPRELKPTVRQYIFTEAIRQRKVPRELLANRLIRELEESHEIPPAFETTKRYISKARNTHNPIDQPWTLGACKEYPSFFPPESLPFLVNSIQFHKEAFVELPGQVRDFYLLVKDPNIFTIRFCIWLLRLKPLIEYLFPEDIALDKYFLQNNLLRLADSYSIAEMTNEFLEKAEFDTSRMDTALFSRDLDSDAFICFPPTNNDDTQIRIHLKRTDKIDDSYEKEDSE